MNNQAYQNTDVEIYRETPSYYSDSLHITQGDGLGIDCGGYVIVMPIRHWHALGKRYLSPPWYKKLYRAIKKDHRGPEKYP